MPRVMIVCPVAERRVTIGIEVEAGPRSRSGVPHSGTVRCDACHRYHTWYRAETVLEGATDPRRQEAATAPKTPGIRYRLGQGDLAPR